MKDKDFTNCSNAVAQKPTSFVAMSVCGDS
jgi:hypothetical protein